MGAVLAVPALASAHPDLSLTKVVDSPSALPGQLLTYTITITNQGTRASQPGSVSDTLPQYTTFVSASSGCTAAAGVVTCALRSVSVGATVSLTVVVRVDADVPAGNLVNVATVTAPGDTPTTNNSGSATSTVPFAGLGDFVWWDQSHDGLQTPGEPGFAGVTVHIYDSSGTLVGTTTTDANGIYRFDDLQPSTAYTVCLDVPGDSAAGGPLDGFQLTTPDVGSDDAIDSDAQLINGSPCIRPATTAGPGSFTPTYDFGFWKAAPTGGVTPASPSTPSSSSGASGAVAGPPRLTLRKSGKPAVVTAGNNVRYALVVANAGRSSAHGVRVCDTLPGGVTVIATGGGKLADGQICWTVGTLAKGKSKQLTLVVKVDLTQTARIVNTAVATASDSPKARASTSTGVTAARSRHGVAGVTG